MLVVSPEDRCGYLEEMLAAAGRTIRALREENGRLSDEIRRDRMAREWEAFSAAHPEMAERAMRNPLLRGLIKA